MRRNFDLLTPNDLHDQERIKWLGALNALQYEWLEVGRKDKEVVFWGSERDLFDGREKISVLIRRNRS